MVVLKEEEIKDTAEEEVEVAFKVVEEAEEEGIKWWEVECLCLLLTVEIYQTCFQDKDYLRDSKCPAQTQMPLPRKQVDLEKKQNKRVVQVLKQWLISKSKLWCNNSKQC